MIRGIGRFPNAEAVDALIAAIRGSESDRPIAVATLSLLTRRIDDPQLLERARSALEAAGAPLTDSAEPLRGNTHEERAKK